MNTQVIIPDIDPIAVPAPLWLLKFLLLLTFTLHILAMNVAVGGGFIAAISEFIGRRRNSQNHLDLSKSISKMLPPFTAFTITLGVAPLLFLQVLYGNFFYTSTILIAWPWLSIIVIFILAYYGYYLYSFSWEKLQGKRFAVVLISSILLAVIGLLYTQNIVLMLTPEKWKDIYFQNPHGTNLYFSDPTVIPRYLHFMVSAVAVAGLVVLMLGLKKIKTNGELGKWRMKYGILWFTIPTLVNILIGLWFLISLPKKFLMLFMGENIYATVYFLIALVAMFVSLIMMFLAYNSAKPVSKIMIGKIFLLLTIVMMVLMRHELREAYLEPYINWNKVQIEPQWDIIAIFGILLIAGLITVIWMLKKSFATKSEKEIGLA